ncbi:MAG: 2,5-diamino-6-(ribosylamino)-4(3H)-pyrimidinone 5'-phosphate reductase [Desulfurococcales archaeon]|nr:2,5-diamino-6-(ribosylamino)-4(3H)-pyrimidinone 5'-phosphate reductase [Desulfurococcales archaeon]
MIPRVTIFSTMTVDGRIASKTGYSKLSCPHDLERLHKLRATHDAVMVGANTVVIDDPRLTVRLVPGKNPTRIVIDSALRTSPSSNVYRTPPPTILVTLRENLDRAATEYPKGVNVIGVPAGPGGVDLRAALEQLWRQGIRSILVEGGGRLNWSLISQGLVDTVKVTVSPTIFGAGTSFFHGEGFDGESQRVKLRLEEVVLCRCGQEVHLSYKVVEPRILPIQAE